MATSTAMSSSAHPGAADQPPSGRKRRHDTPQPDATPSPAAGMAASNQRVGGGASDHINSNSTCVKAVKDMTGLSIRDILICAKALEFYGERVNVSSLFNECERTRGKYSDSSFLDQLSVNDTSIYVPSSISPRSSSHLTTPTNTHRHNVPGTSPSPRPSPSADIPPGDEVDGTRFSCDAGHLSDSDSVDSIGSGGSDVPEVTTFRREPSREDAAGSSGQGNTVTGGKLPATCNVSGQLTSNVPLGNTTGTSGASLAQSGNGQSGSNTRGPQIASFGTGMTASTTSIDKPANWPAGLPLNYMTAKVVGDEGVRTFNVPTPPPNRSSQPPPSASRAAGTSAPQNSATGAAARTTYEVQGSSASKPSSTANSGGGGNINDLSGHKLPSAGRNDLECDSDVEYNPFSRDTNTSLKSTNDDLKALKMNDINEEAIRIHKMLNLVESENKKLEEYRHCTKCHKNPRGITFLPCGHFLTCRDCAGPIYTCIQPQCKKNILATVDTYLS